MEQKLMEAAAALPQTALSFEELSEDSIRGRNKPVFSCRRALAACLALVMCLSLGVYTYRAEAQEYETALAFFQENGLSVEGLTRGEIKAVYRDISTKSFTFSKTGQVILGSLSQEQIEGFDILQPEPTPEDVENLWNYKQHGAWFVPYEYPEYMGDVEFITDSNGYVTDSKYFVERYENGELVWRVAVPSLTERFLTVRDGTIACDNNLYRDENSTLKADGWVAKISNDGELLWLRWLDNGFDLECPDGVLENADGSYTLFSRGDKEYLCVSQYSAEGELIAYKQTYMGQFDIRQVAHYAGGYLLQISASEDNEAARFIRVDRQGNVTEGFSYYDAEYIYHIQDMVEYGGKIYISAYTTPRLGADERDYGGRTEIARILAFAFNYEDSLEIPNEVLTPKVRENYRAVLLVCDPENGGKMETFYAIPGSLGTDLILTEDGQLIWETESITDTFYSPFTSSFTIGGQCCVYQYFFNADGNLFSMGKTDRVTNFRR